MTRIRLAAALVALLALLSLAFASTASATATGPTFTFPTFGTVVVNGHITADKVYAVYEIDNSKCTGTTFTADCAPQHLYGHVTIPAGHYEDKSFTIPGAAGLCGPVQQDVGSTLQTDITYPQGTIGFLAGNIAQLGLCNTPTPPPVPGDIKFTAQQDCTAASYTIEHVDGITYTANGEPVGDGKNTLPINFSGLLTVKAIDGFTDEVLKTWTHTYTVEIPACVPEGTVHVTETHTCDSITWTVSVDEDGVKTVFLAQDTPPGEPWLQSEQFTVEPGATGTQTLVVIPNNVDYTRGPDTFTLDQLNPVTGDTFPNLSSVVIASTGCITPPPPHVTPPPAPKPPVIKPVVHPVVKPVVKPPVTPVVPAPPATNLAFTGTSHVGTQLLMVSLFVIAGVGLVALASIGTRRRNRGSTQE